MEALFISEKSMVTPNFLFGYKFKFKFIKFSKSYLQMNTACK